MSAGVQKSSQLPDTMINAVQVRHAHPVGLFPEQIDYIDCLAGIVCVENRPQPALLIHRLAFYTEFHPLSAGLDFQFRDTWIKSEALSERYALGELLR
ncbi:MAG TPA: hypothetical protein VG167_03110 [Verrucomicrobiae bacterium]|nr:hypothetical protein [Verrucomicrobiae bacterium]